MLGAVLALIIALMMIVFVICKGNAVSQEIICCRKSELHFYTESIPENCIIQIRIGRNTYDAGRNRNAARRNIRNNISK